MTRPSIGVFDSGVGGLSVLREIKQRLPHEPLVYFADQTHVPYGSRSLNDVQALSEGITRFLLEQGCELVVVACNTASAAALHLLRSNFPTTPFVGMEPAVKPAAERSETRKVAVLATPATFQGALFASVVDRFADGVEVVEIVAPGLVELIESGQTTSGEIDSALSEALEPAKSQGIDTLVLACTHYSFVVPAIQRILGPNVIIIDPAPAVARQTERLWEGKDAGANTSEGAGTQSGISTQAGTSARYITSGDPGAFRSSMLKLVGEGANTEPASWVAGTLIATS